MKIYNIFPSANPNWLVAQIVVVDLEHHGRKGARVVAHVNTYTVSAEAYGCYPVEMAMGMLRERVAKHPVQSLTQLFNFLTYIYTGSRSWIVQVNRDHFTVVEVV